MVSFELNPEDQTPLPEPAGFDITDIARDTALLRWTAPDDERVLKYK